MAQSMFSVGILEDGRVDISIVEEIWLVGEYRSKGRQDEGLY